MTDFERGDVVLVGFVFLDESGVKRRPAVIVSSEAYNKGRGEAIIAAITSNVDRVLLGDHLITDWRGAGLLFPSVTTCILRTVKRGMVVGRLGSMPSSDMAAIEDKLRLALGLS